jgi:H+/Cl- antiporter ClcA
MTADELSSPSGSFAKAEMKAGEVPDALGDFTATKRMIPISALAVGIGVVGAMAANALLQLIGLATNLFFYQRISTETSSPAQNTLGVLAVFVPVVGALIVGLMARFGSEKIRGHGIPEALEAILTRGSRVEPKVALLKPLSSAISIGSGGPFGAEGPIIMTGGAFGSMIAQVFHLTSAERKTLLVAGAAAGMSATFATPLAATLLAVELLLFEFKPRSFVPVALASATAMIVRHHLLGPGPIFTVPTHVAFAGPGPLALCAGVGLVAGIVSALMTLSVYVFEDAFKKLPIHWMWWPALGAVVIGVGGLICPRALGVGYEVIGTTLADASPLRDVLILVAVKWTIWAVSLGSGTSGGVLAPLLMIGASTGAILGHWLPDEGHGFWALVAMGAILGGTMRSPLTGTVFAVELTHDWGSILPVLIAASTAHAFTVLVLKRSILTEKVARKGYHITREYEIDPLAVLFVRDVMEPGEVEGAVVAHHGEQFASQTRDAGAGGEAPPIPAARSDEPLREVVVRMAETGRTRLAVVDDGQVLGVVTLEHMLKARARHLEEETRRERIIRTDGFLPPLLRPSWNRLTSLSTTDEA